MQYAGICCSCLTFSGVNVEAQLIVKRTVANLIIQRSVELNFFSVYPSSAHFAFTESGRQET